MYVVSTPIGNADDISMRAVKVLKLADVVVCEEGRVGARLMHQLRLTKTIEELHEHNEEEQTPRLLSMLKEGKELALISDAGTPLLADPGLELVQQAVAHSVPVIAVPGASSIMTGIVTSGLPVHQFIFAGFLSRDPDERLAQLRDLADETRTVVLLETPYRLLPLLEAAARIIPERRAYLGCNLTMPSETRHYGTVAELLEKFRSERFKGEFVFVFAGRDKGGRSAARSEKEGGLQVPRRGRPVRVARAGTSPRQGVRRSSGADAKGRSDGGKKGGWKDGNERKGGGWKSRSDTAGAAGSADGRSGGRRGTEGRKPAGKGGFRGKKNTPGGAPGRRKK